MAVVTVVKTIGSTGTFSTPALWESGAPADLTTAEKSAATTFLTATFVQGEALSFVGSGAVGVLLDTDSTGPGTGTYVTYGLLAGDPAANDVVTGTSTATCVLTSSTPDNVGVIWQGQCQNEEFTAATAVVTISGSAVSATCYKEITTVAGASFRDNSNKLTNALRYDAANGCGLSCTGTSTTLKCAINNSETYTRISNLQCKNVHINSSCVVLGDGLADNLIIEGKYSSTSTGTGVLNILGGTIRNSLIIQRTSNADHIVSTGAGSPFFYNCLIVAADDLAIAPAKIFISGASGTVTVQNCGLFAGDSTKAIKAGSATFNFTTCNSDISGTAGVTQVTFSSEFQNVTDAASDYRLKAGAASIDAGTTDATNAATDIVGTARPQGASYDISAWEYAAAVAGGSNSGNVGNGGYYGHTRLRRLVG